MAIQTTNIGLTKPIGTENVSRQIVNDNYDIIDTEFGYMQRIFTVSVDTIETPTEEEFDNASIGSAVKFVVKNLYSEGIIHTDPNKYQGIIGAYPSTSNNKPYFLQIVLGGNDLLKPDTLYITFIKVNERTGTFPQYEHIVCKYLTTRF